MMNDLLRALFSASQLRQVVLEWRELAMVVLVLTAMAFCLLLPWQRSDTDCGRTVSRGQRAVVDRGRAPAGLCPHAFFRVRACLRIYVCM